MRRGSVGSNEGQMTKNERKAVLAISLFVIFSSLFLHAQPVFRGGVDLATFAAAVTDRKGNLVTGLTKDDFEVIEDGMPQTIEYFAQGDGDAGPPMHLGLMVDASGSMHADMKLAQGAAIKFLNMLPAAEDITLVDFDTQVRITRYPQRDFARLVERIRQRKPDGFTALYDALGTYLDGADSQDGRKVLAEIKGQYHVGYLSTNTAKDGAWRKVDIRVKRPDARVRTRKGYFGPYRPSAP